VAHRQLGAPKSVISPDQLGPGAALPTDGSKGTAPTASGNTHRKMGARKSVISPNQLGPGDPLPTDGSKGTAPLSED
jgi:hypothetical protein